MALVLASARSRFDWCHSFCAIGSISTWLVHKAPFIHPPGRPKCQRTSISLWETLGTRGPSHDIELNDSSSDKSCISRFMGLPVPCLINASWRSREPVSQWQQSVYLRTEPPLAHSLAAALWRFRQHPGSFTRPPHSFHVTGIATKKLSLVSYL